MNKTLCICLSAMLLLPFAGCSQTNASVDAGKEISSASPAESKPVTDAEPSHAPSHAAQPGAATDQSTTPQYISLGQNFYGNGFINKSYENDNWVSCFLDMDTMVNAPLCAVPNCAHKDSNCLAVRMGDAPVLFENSAYFFEAEADVRDTPDGAEFYIDSKLKKASLDASEVQSVCQFTDTLPRIGDGYILDGSMLYFIGYDPDPKDDGYGGLSWGSAGGHDYVCSVDLKNGQYQRHGEVCYVEDEFPAADSTSSAKLLGFYDGKAYIGYSFMKEYDENADYTEEQTMDVWTMYSFTFDLATHEIQKCDLPYAAWARENAYAYYEGKDQFTVICKGEQQQFTGKVNMFYIPVYEGRAFGKESWFDLSDHSEHSMSSLKKDADDQITYVTCYNGNHILRHSDGSFEKLTEDELLSLQ